MRRYGTLFWAANLALSALAGKAYAAPATDAMISEIGAALDGGDAVHARRLADTALAEGAVTPMQRGRLLLDRGLARELQGDHTAALADFTGALATRALPVDERAQALLQRGFLLDGLNRLEEAGRDYSAVADLKTPLAPTALNNRANIQRRQGRLAEARRDYLAALSAGSSKPQFPYFGLGQIAEAQHDAIAARGFYAKAVRADPDYRMAAERLEVLGGPPDAALDDPDRIALKPPKSDAPLRPPSAAPVRDLPPRRNLSKPAVQPGLRPALDQAVGGGSGSQVQLGAWRSAAEAQTGWAHAQARAAKVLAGMAPIIVRADLPGRGAYFRLRLATPDPAGLCARLAGLKLDCVRVRE